MIAATISTSPMRYQTCLRNIGRITCDIMIASSIKNTTIPARYQQRDQNTTDIQNIQVNKCNIVGKYGEKIKNRKRLSIFNTSCTTINHLIKAVFPSFSHGKCFLTGWADFCFFPNTTFPDFHRLHYALGNQGKNAEVRARYSAKPSLPIYRRSCIGIPDTPIRRKVKNIQETNPQRL